VARSSAGQRLRVCGVGALSPSASADERARLKKLLAEGLATSEIADELNYSERTVKNIVHAVLTRFNLRNRNRNHAVAHGLRDGVLVTKLQAPVLLEAGVCAVLVSVCTFLL
jgi:DNA-binding NarL/FixJ family response regulator